MEFATPASLLHVTTILPEGILVVSLIFMIIVDLLQKPKKVEGIVGGAGRRAAKPPLLPPSPSQSQNTTWIALTGLSLAILVLIHQWNQAPSLAFLGSFQADPLSVAFRLLIVLSAFVSICFCHEYMEQVGIAVTEFVIFLIGATIGGMLLSGANDLIMVFVALECLGLSSYLLSGHMKKDARSNEAAIKYLILGGTSSSILAYGLSWLYGLSGGKIIFKDIFQSLSVIVPSWLSNNQESIAPFSLGLIIALLLVLVGIAFKISAVPFHQWTPDVYEGSPTPAVAFLSVGSKTAGFALITRLIIIICSSLSNGSVGEQILITEITGGISGFLFLCSLFSMILGNLVAITQSSMKRMLAYSSISQGGYMIIGLIASLNAPYGGSLTDDFRQEGYASLLLYLGIYLFMNLGAFGCTILFSLRTGTDQIRDYNGLYRKDPWLAFCFSLCLLSLGGLPPLTGFFAKFYLFWVGWQSSCYALVIVGLFTSAISIYYYLRVMKSMFINEPKQTSTYLHQYSLGVPILAETIQPSVDFSMLDPKNLKMDKTIPKLAKNQFQIPLADKNQQTIYLVEKQDSFQDSKNLSPSLLKLSLNICVVLATLLGIFINPFIIFAQDTLLRSTSLL
uniref:NAD(P)H-quinone oxidoreductase subunit 2, chloroplastic n=1 Tax=Entransia fimbriata TaxID=130991 RepID=A0A191T4N3_9VIRI|nr:subunit 2 of NADH-plastoquinone oxidoreductase [Entransia fimbriata]YP_009256738.1 subunit 2 of NADH-plastoquinone oxidoreductase [Entransia fimbriata]ANI25358.1 subunit 2 of NADH-plastoquinone oxidoreductase [Entransia fimbriata]ANI25439.1 subunit 2 of NADH-plastoquinone oxidoreductase [Entransia fimbriata]WKT05715.1 subunit 2 of NADH-plastoquinone oxidoreductase [Entransia fimbriata]WKT05716.1 subunit 2 of NADH-plastoquinone oxidoreductase [Entransia fimbriata]WKT05834.1 subunit 2 of NAD